MQIRQRIQQLKSGNNPDKMVNTIVLTMKEMGWSWEQMREVPVSAYGIIVDELNKEAKRQNQKMKSNR